jgi:uncharacterized protein YjdB
MHHARPARTALRALLLPLTAAVLASCNLPTVCTQELSVEVLPRDRSIRIGQEFTATATAVSCGGRERSPYTVAWTSRDPAVAGVDAATGRVQGLSSGTARIRAHEPHDAEAVWGEVRVTVTP